MRRAIPTILAILLLAGAAAAQEAGPKIFSPEEGQKLGQLQQETGEAFNFKDYEKGLGLLVQTRELLEKGLARVTGGEVDTGGHDKEAVVAQLEGMIAVNWYNEGCCLSQLGRKGEAIEALGRSIDLGYIDVDHMKLDGDLDNVRNEPGYKALLDGLNYNEVVEVYTPSSAAEKAPLLVALHGGGENETGFLAKLKAFADARGVIVAAPRGPITSAKGKYDWKRYSDDEESALKKVLWTIEKVKAEHPVDAQKVYLFGLGSGGYFATLTALSRPEVVKGAISANAFWNKYYFEDFLAKASANSVRIVLVHGKDEPFFKKAQDGVKQMEEAKIRAALQEFDGGKELPADATDIVKKAWDWVVNP